MEEKKIILKYRRPVACWKCSECDIENFVEADKCMMCGNVRTTTDSFIRAWSPEDERVVPTINNPREVAPTMSPAPLYKYERKEESETEDSKGIVALYVIIAIAVIALIVVMTQMFG